MVKRSRFLKRPRATRRGLYTHYRRGHFKRGTILLEQVLLIALAAGGASLATDSIDLATQSKLAQLELASHQSNEADEALHGELGSIRSNSDYSIDIANATESIYILRMLAIGGFLILGIGIWYLLYKKAKKAWKAPATTSVEQSDSNTDLFSANVFSKRQEILRALLENPSSVTKNQLKIRQLMSTRLVIIKGTSSKKKVQNNMAGAGTRHLLVCDESEKLIGIISNRDLARSGSTAAQIMTPNPTTLEADSPLLPTITLLLKQCISCLPVTEKGKLVGVLTTTDLIMALQCTFQIIERSGIAGSNPPKAGTQNQVEENVSSLAP